VALNVMLPANSAFPVLMTVVTGVLLVEKIVCANDAAEKQSNIAAAIISVFVFI
jgi:hypothetical protein